MKKQILLFLLSITTIQINAHAIIFDLHGVLMYTSKRTFFDHIGLPALINYSFTTDLQNIETVFFDFLENIKPKTDTHAGWRTPDKELPQIMTDWLKGSLRSQDIQLLIHEHADTYFQDTAQKEMALAIAHMIFTPRILANNAIVCEQAIAFVRLCKLLGHKVYLLSNLDTETYTCLQEKHPWFWKLFDGVAISGEVGCIKPDPKIYQLALEKFAIDPHDAIFIDDISHNIEAAEQLGIFGVVCKQSLVGYDNIPHVRYIKDMVRIWWDAQYYKKYFGIKKKLAALS